MTMIVNGHLQKGCENHPNCGTLGKDVHNHEAETIEEAKRPVEKEEEEEEEEVIKSLALLHLRLPQQPVVATYSVVAELKLLLLILLLLAEMT